MCRVRLVRMKGHKSPFHSRGHSIWEFVFGCYFEERMFGRLRRVFGFHYVSHNWIRRTESAEKGPLILRFEGKQRSPTRYYYDD